MKHLFEIRGKGRCAGSVAHVLAIDEQNARVRLLRDDACPHFEIERVELFAIRMDSLAFDAWADAVLRSPHDRAKP